MKRIITVSFFAILMGNVQAKEMDNSKMVTLYKNQLEQTKQLAYETQQLLNASETVVDLAKKISTSSAGLEIKAINLHFKLLDETSTQLYGSYPAITHFEGCKRLPMNASFVWQAHLDNLGRDNTTLIKSSTDSYVSALKDCAKEIKTPPPSKVEEPDNLQIIDVE